MSNEQSIEIEWKQSENFEKEVWKYIAIVAMVVQSLIRKNAILNTVIFFLEASII